jgi:hypothetical protein
MKTHPDDSSLWKTSQGARRGLERILEHIAACAKCRTRLARTRRQDDDEIAAFGRSLYTQFPQTKNRRLWLEGSIAYELGRRVRP